jgi:hypothetical protein
MRQSTEVRAGRRRPLTAAFELRVKIRARLDGCEKAGNECIASAERIDQRPCQAGRHRHEPPAHQAGSSTAAPRCDRGSCPEMAQRQQQRLHFRVRQLRAHGYEGRLASGQQRRLGLQCGGCAQTPQIHRDRRPRGAERVDELGGPTGHRQVYPARAPLRELE